MFSSLVGDLSSIEWRGAFLDTGRPTYSRTLVAFHDTEPKPIRSGSLLPLKRKYHNSMNLSEWDEIDLQVAIRCSSINCLCHQTAS